MKKIKKKLCSVILCVTLIFQVTFYDYYEAEAAALPLGIGIWEIIQGLLLSAGVTYLTYEGIENMNSDDYVDIALASYLKESYDTNLRIIEGAASGQMPSSSPSPSPSPTPVTGLPGDQSQAPRYWDALITAFYENEMIEFTETEWKAWKITVETFINDAFGHGADYNILQVDANAASKFQKAKELACEKYNIDFKYSTYRAIVPGNAWYDAYENQRNIYSVYLFPKNCYYTLFEDKTGAGYPSYGVNFKNAERFRFCVVTYTDEWDGESTTENIDFYSEIVSGTTQTILRLEYESPYYCINMPYMIPDIAPYIGDRPSEDTITIVPEIQPDPDSEEEKKPYVIPNEVPEPMKIPTTEQIGDLYNDIQDDPDNAPENLKTLQEELMIEPNPEPEPDTDTNPAPSVAPSAVPDVTVPENAGNYTYDFSDLFPFCIPKDFYNLLCVFNAKAEAPKFEIPFDISYAGIEYHKKFTLDMSEFEEVIKIFRLICIISFIVTLIWITRNFIKW